MFEEGVRYQRDEVVEEVAEELDISRDEAEEEMDELIEDGIVVEYADGSVEVRSIMAAMTFLARGKSSLKGNAVRDRFFRPTGNGGDTK